MGLVELCLMEGAQQLLESAAYNTSRLAKTGYHTDTQTQAYLINQLMIKELSSYGSLIKTTQLVTTQNVYNSFHDIALGNGAGGLGDTSEIVVFTISYTWKIFTPIMCSALGSTCKTGNIVNLTSRVVVRNEPY